MANQKKPRVLLICTNSDEAGAPLHVETLVRMLRDHVDFTLLFGEDGPVLHRLSAAGFDAQLLDGMRSSISPLKDLQLVYKLRYQLRTIKPDLIHCHSSKAGLIGRCAGLIENTPTLFTIHGWSWTGLKGRNATLARWIERRLSRISRSNYIFVCKAMQDVGQAQLGFRVDQGQIIYNGMPDIGIMGPPAGPLTIFMPARVSPQKDHETLVRAFDNLPVGRSQLLLCGAGTDTPQFAKYVNTWAPTRCGEIITLGQRSDIPAQLRRSHLLVLSSHWEALPLSIIEAMSTGLPVIASNVGGISEQVTNEVTGLLVPPGDVSAMTAALQRMFDPATRNRMGLAGRQRYEADFTATAMAEATLAYYRRLI